MLEILRGWQELISGILALLAGTFVFVQGRVERRAFERARRQDIVLENSKTRLILERLERACSDLVDQIERSLENLEDVLLAIDRGDKGIELPDHIVIPKIFEVIFAQLTTRDVDIQIYLDLSLLLERGTTLDEDFRRFLVSYGQTVTEYRAVQPRLPLGGSLDRRSADEPAAQTLLISTKALQEVAVAIKLQIVGGVEGEAGNGGHVRTSDERMVQMQPLERTAQYRKERP